MKSSRGGFLIAAAFVMAFGLGCTAARADSKGWKAGAAAVAITPEKPIWMAGYASRTKPAEGKETEL